MAGMFKFVDIGPDLRLPSLFMRGRFSTGGTTGMKRDLALLATHGSGSGQLYEDASHFLNFFIDSENVLVAEQVSETELPRLRFRLRARTERSIFGSKLFRRVACHPKGFCVCHLQVFAPVNRPCAAPRALTKEIQAAGCNYGAAVMRGKANVYSGARLLQSAVVKGFAELSACM
jgi:hypothetical protein